MIKFYKLYANINPLYPNTELEVDDSRKYMCKTEDALSILKRKGRELKDKGHKITLMRITEDILEF